MKHLFAVLAVLATGLQVVLATPTPLSLESNKLKRSCRVKGESCMNLPYPLLCCEGEGECGRKYGPAICS
ncbi:hypothetical protein RSOLAG22IIIB_12929 [Rhizoctonia solani]|uniref:Uncharacterized protein n=1 Tax=Rhizoctonia solani TaxID=456999 RepID=A0A0K6GH74_9AGAM|nr:unnamed protein product [Rhizoctonia solani]CUA77943.1 hypothetical protein RSOLAG22IIIB_12929 [Rhizoctonia solani]